MGLTPDEIAERAFTPSVDGYHQGEVRSFLRRIAVEVGALQSVLPEGRLELAEITTALHDHEPRLRQLELRLAEVVADLRATAEHMRAAQNETAQDRALSQHIATDHDAATAVVDALCDLIEGFGAKQQAMLTEMVAQQRASDERLRFARELVADQQTVADQLTATSQLTASHLEAAKAISAHAGSAAAQIDAALAQNVAAVESARSRQPSTDVRDDLRAAIAARPTAVYTDPIDGARLEAPMRSTAAAPVGATALVRAERRDQPRFSDSANDLLDGVLDDVMERLTDEGRTAT